MVDFATPSSILNVVSSVAGTFTNSMIKRNENRTPITRKKITPTFLTRLEMVGFPMIFEEKQTVPVGKSSESKIFSTPLAINKKHWEAK